MRNPREGGALKVALVSLPFASILRPSLGLAQIESRLKERFGNTVQTTIHYLNMDFARSFGLRFYNLLAESMGPVTGMGDWFFREAAFPDLPENADEYFRQCHPPSEGTAILRKHVEKRRRNAGVVLERLIDEHALDKADIVGFTSTFSQTAASIAMARLLKERHRDLTIVMGGANCESTMGRALARNVSVVDFVFSGPALVSFPRFVGHVLNEEFEQLHTITGVFSRRNQAPDPFPLVSEKAAAATGEELDIDTDIDLEYGDYLAKFKALCAGSGLYPWLPFETSRGCWWGRKAHCTFCGLNGESMAYRSMHPDRAVNLIDSLFRRYGNECAHFQAVDNILPRNYVEDVFSRISAPPGTSLFYEVKAELSGAELAALSKAGVRYLQPGIESFATSSLRLIRKGTTATQNVQFLRNCAMNGIRPQWNLLIGLPGEPEEVYRKYCEDLPLLTHLFPPNCVTPVRFDRFSPYFSKANEYELDLRPAPFYALTYPYPERELFDLAYYFVDRRVRPDYFAALEKWREKLQQIVAQWQKRWYEQKGAGSPLLPQLYFAQTAGGEILDSRSGAVLEHDVGCFGRRLLETLYKPRTAGLLAQEYPDEPVGETLAVLQGKGLVFREGEHLTGLVCPHEPPACP